ISTRPGPPTCGPHPSPWATTAGPPGSAPGRCCGTSSPADSATAAAMVVDVRDAGHDDLPAVVALFNDRLPLHGRELGPRGRARMGPGLRPGVDGGAVRAGPGRAGPLVQRVLDAPGAGRW